MISITKENTVEGKLTCTHGKWTCRYIMDLCPFSPDEFDL